MLGSQRRVQRPLSCRRELQGHRFLAVACTYVPRPIRAADLCGYHEDECRRLEHEGFSEPLRLLARKTLAVLLYPSCLIDRRWTRAGEVRTKFSSLIGARKVVGAPRSQTMVLRIQRAGERAIAIMLRIAANDQGLRGGSQRQPRTMIVSCIQFAPTI